MKDKPTGYEADKDCCMLQTAGWLVVLLGDCLYHCSKLDNGTNVCPGGRSRPFPQPTDYE